MFRSKTPCGRVSRGPKLGTQTQNWAKIVSTSTLLCQNLTQKMLRWVHCCCCCCCCCCCWCCWCHHYLNVVPKPHPKDAAVGSLLLLASPPPSSRSEKITSKCRNGFTVFTIVSLYSWIYFSQLPKHQVSFRGKQNVQTIFPFCGFSFLKSPSTIIIVTKW